MQNRLSGTGYGCVDKAPMGGIVLGLGQGRREPVHPYLYEGAGENTHLILEWGRGREPLSVRVQPSRPGVVEEDIPMH